MADSEEKRGIYLMTMIVSLIVYIDDKPSLAEGAVLKIGHSKDFSARKKQLEREYGAHTISDVAYIDVGDKDRSDAEGKLKKALKEFQLNVFSFPKLTQRTELYCVTNEVVSMFVSFSEKHRYSLTMNMTGKVYESILGMVEEAESGFHYEMYVFDDPSYSLPTDCTRLKGHSTCPRDAFDKGYFSDPDGISDLVREDEKKSRETSSRDARYHARSLRK